MQNIFIDFVLPIRILIIKIELIKMKSLVYLLSHEYFLITFVKKLSHKLQNYNNLVILVFFEK